MGPESLTAFILRVKLMRIGKQQATANAAEWLLDQEKRWREPFVMELGSEPDGVIG